MVLELKLEIETPYAIIRQITKFYKVNKYAQLISLIFSQKVDLRVCFYSFFYFKPTLYNRIIVNNCRKLLGIPNFQLTHEAPCNL